MKIACGFVLALLAALVLAPAALAADPSASASRVVLPPPPPPVVNEPDLVGPHRSLAVKDVDFTVDAATLTDDVLLHLIVIGVDTTIHLPPAWQLSGSTPAVWVSATEGGRFTVPDPDGGPELMFNFTTRGAVICNSDAGHWYRVQ